MADEQKKETAPSGGGSPLDNKIVLLAVIVVTQALMAVAVTQFVIAPKLRAVTTSTVSEAAAPGQQAKKKDETKDPGVLVDLNKIVVSLRDKGPTSSYLSIDINLEVDNAKTADMVTQRLPHLRDIVILALSNKYAEDLMSYDGKEALKAELMRKIGEVLPEHSLQNIYFSEMVVQ